MMKLIILTLAAATALVLGAPQEVPTGNRRGKRSAPTQDTLAASKIESSAPRHIPEKYKFDLGPQETQRMEKRSAEKFEGFVCPIN